MLGEPVDLRVVGEHRVFELRRADEPTLTRILDERILFRPPAEWIVVDVLFLMEQQPALLQIADDVFVAILDPTAAAILRGFVSEFAVGTDAIYKCWTFVISKVELLFGENFIIIFTESRRDMYEAGTTLNCHKVRRNDAPSNMLFALYPFWYLPRLRATRNTNQMAVNSDSQRVAFLGFCRPGRISCFARFATNFSARADATNIVVLSWMSRHSS